MLLHNLDLRRKHRNLLRLAIEPGTMTYSVNRVGFKFSGDPAGTRMRRLSDRETPLLLLTRDKLDISPR